MEVDHVQESPTDPPIRFVGEMTAGDEVPHIGVGSNGMGAQIRNLVAREDRFESLVEMIAITLVLDQQGDRHFAVASCIRRECRDDRPYRLDHGAIRHEPGWTVEQADPRGLPALGHGPTHHPDQCRIVADVMAKQEFVVEGVCRPDLREILLPPSRVGQPRAELLERAHQRPLRFHPRCTGEVAWVSERCGPLEPPGHRIIGGQSLHARAQDAEDHDVRPPAAVEIVGRIRVVRRGRRAPE